MLPFEWLGHRLGTTTDGAGSIYDRPTRDAQARPATRPVQPTCPPTPPLNLTSLLKADIDLTGADRYWTRCQIVHRDGDAQLLDPPPPFRGHLRLLSDIDPNPGPDGQLHRVLLIVAGQPRTCHEAAAATFRINPADYSPSRET
jgi:hypothetical protein